MILASADQSAHITSDTSMRFFLNTEAKIILIRNEIEWLGQTFSDPKGFFFYQQPSFSFILFIIFMKT